MTTHLFSSLLLLSLAAVATWIAYRKGFFRITRVDRLNTGVTGLMLVALFALYFGLQMGLILLAARVFSSVTVAGAGGVHLVIVGLSAFAVIAYKAHFFLKRPLIPHLGIGALCFLLAFPLSAGVEQLAEGILTGLMGPLEKEQTVVTFLKGLRAYPILFGLSTVMTVVLVPIVEEILFRGGLQGWLRKRMGMFGAIGISSALFALVHFGIAQKWTNLTLMAFLFPLSLCLGFLYERQRSLWAPIALHGAVNGVAMLGMLLGFEKGC